MSGARYKIADQNSIGFLTVTVVDRIDVFTRKENKYGPVKNYSSKPTEIECERLD
jgi:hypothetical protein